MANRLTRIARRLRARSTTSEDALWEQLRDRRCDGFKFRRQVPIAGFVTDFCCLDLGLTIEVDGKQHLEQIERDTKRRAAIESYGFIELRFSNEEVRERLDWVMEEIRRTMDIARAKTPRPAFPRME